MTPLVVTDETPEQWRQLEPLTYRGSRDTFTVPAGYVTNFASVPRLLWWFIPRYGRYTKATVLHDCLCDDAGDDVVRRRDADGIFRRTMRELGVPLLRRRIMWAGVRWGAGLRAILASGWAETLQVAVLSAVALVFILVPGITSLVAMALYSVVQRVVELFAPRRRSP